MKKAILIFSIIFFINSYSYSQKTIISGNAKTYAGTSLKLYTYKDFIVKEKKILATAYVDTSGDFRFETDIKETLSAFIDLNVFRGVLYIEPEKEYKIVLPKKTKRSIEDELNPYFIPQDFYVRILNSNKYELNNAIKKFDKLYNETFIKLFTNYKGRVYSKVTEDQIKYVNNQMSYIDNKFFDNYKKYEFVILRFTAYNRNKEKILNDYFASSPVLYNNPAYHKALDKIFKSYIFDLKNDSLKYMTEIKVNWNQINSALTQVTKINNNALLEYLLLINLHFSFYNNVHLKRKFLKIIKSAEQESKIEMHKKIASNFIKKAEILIVGNPAPDFSLQGRNGDFISLNNFSGKFVYLCFCSPQSYPSEKDMDALENLFNKKIDLLKIVTVWKGKSLEKMNDFIDKKHYNRTFIYCDKNNQALIDYEINTYPTYFLINPENKLLMISAPGPAEGFEAIYFRVYQNWKRELARRKHEKESKFDPNKPNNSLFSPK